ncbi:MAG: UvrD-helicase domain-containing protein [Clostridia bacterium]|nr:UvrD-helicase domain-containing protein [Clostridia bacterium]
MARNWTSAQSAAMSTFGQTLLISAAAGSGKTATLTERIIRRLTDPEHPADLSRMLIVTFTRAAAAELKERISSALSEAIAKDPGNRHLQRQLIGLGGAHISTIDAFCREPVKTNFAVLGLPASTRIADEAELRPLCERVLGDLIDEFYLKYADNSQSKGAFSLLWGNPFADLCDSLTPSKNDADLIPAFLSLYNRLLSFPEELERLKTEAEELRIASETDYFDFFATRHGEILRAYTAEFAKHGIRVMESALDLIDGDERAVNAYGPSFRADLDFCYRLAEVSTYEEAYFLTSAYQKERLGALRNPEPDCVTAKEMRTDLTDDIKSLRDTYFRDSSETIRAQMADTAILCTVLHDFLMEYDRRIQREKINRGICDFTDNRRYLLKLLENKDGTPSPMALEFCERFDEVYIDEYQDVDEMQDTIFRLIGGDHRFMVGDIKQSIYGFRGADPSVFARYRRDLKQLFCEGEEWKGHDGNGNTIFMSDNFRCDESVIRVTNAICGHMFRGCPLSINYQPEDDLGFSKLKPFDDYVSPKVSVNILVNPPRTRGEEPATDSELSGVEAEAAFVAGEISRLLHSRTPLANGEPVKPSDIVILMRNRTTLSTYVKALTDLGIPTGSEELEAAEAGRDLFHGSDMSYLVNLLRVIDNPDSDIPLSEILRAPFPGLNLEELIAVRRVGDRAAESCSLYMGVEEYPSKEGADAALSAKLIAFTTWLERYRRLATTQPADGLLRLLQRDDACACRETAAFRFLYESARTCRTSAFVSLNAFLRYFESKLATSKTAPVVEGKGDGHVSIMTIHKSKGLEFPVCFVVRCGQAFSARSYSSDMIFEKRAGVSLKLYHRKQDGETTHQAKEDTALRTVSALAVRLAEREEEMRVLYVAMTRAREHLYLVGMGNGKPHSFEEGDRFATLACSSYLKWILAGLSAHPDVLEKFATLSIIPAEDLLPGEPVSMAEISRRAEVDPEAIVRYATILKRLTPPSPLENALRHVPTKVPASRMKDGLLDDCVFYDTDLVKDEDGKLPYGEESSWCDAQSLAAIRQSLALMKTSGENEFELLLTENRRPTATEKGTAAHLFLQFCDYELVMQSGVEAEIHRLTELGFINSRTAKILDRTMLRSFFDGEFFAHMRQADDIKREFRFSRFVPLSKLTVNQELARALGDKTLLVQGSIDLLCFFSDGHIELCDYKTDHITSAERNDPSLLQKRMQERHGEQLSQYVIAIEETFGRRPTKAYVYSLTLGAAIDISVS